MAITFIYILFYLLLYFNANTVNGRINIKFTNFQCISLDKKSVEFTQCSMKAIKRDLTELNVYVKLLQKPIRNSSVKVNFKKRYDKRNSIYQYHVDACEFLRNKRRNPLADMFFQFFEFLKYSNVNHTCPYDHDIILRNCRVNTRALKFLTIAQGEYTFHSTWFAYNKPFGEININMNIS